MYRVCTTISAHFGHRARGPLSGGAESLDKPFLMSQLSNREGLHNGQPMAQWQAIIAYRPSYPRHHQFGRGTNPGLERSRATFWHGKQSLFVSIRPLTRYVAPPYNTCSKFLYARHRCHADRGTFSFPCQTGMTGNQGINKFLLCVIWPSGSGKWLIGVPGSEGCWHRC
jgi:hypothetical protein